MGLALIDTSSNHLFTLLSMVRDGGGFLARKVVGHSRLNVMLCRVDEGEDLEAVHVQVLYAFVQEAALRTGFSLGGETTVEMRESAQEGFLADLTPEKFVAFWGDFRERSPEIEREAVGECPVKLGCKGCGEDDRDDGKKMMMRCGKCRVVKYCGKECQKADWGKHRKVCFKA